MEREVPGESQYRVTAPLVVVRCAPDGAYHHLYQGALLPGSADPQQIETMLAGGMIERLRKDLA